MHAGPCEIFPCKNGGVCSEEGSSFSCECPKDYQGKTCESKCNYYAIVCIAAASYAVLAGVVESFKSIAQLLDQAL